jgi:hypothetical protein
MLDATALLKLYAHRRRKRLATLVPHETQQRQLLSLLCKAQATRFGKDHGFAALRKVNQYQQRVPLRRYETFRQDYWQNDFPRLVDCSWPGTIPFFAVTSGTTTGVTKYIPVSHAMNLANRYAAMDLLVHHIINRPHSRLLGGRNFMLGGSTNLERLAPGIYSGDLSGIAAKVVPWWARLRYYPPKDLESIQNWEQKIQTFAADSIHKDIRSINGIPSWMLIFFDKLAELHPQVHGRLSDYWPNLELLVHGGINFAPYRRRFQELLAGSHAETREAYAASEGFMAVADRGDGEGLRLILDNGMFFEFVPVEELNSANPVRHWIANVELNVNYAIVVSTCAGVWACPIGDTVKFVDLDPPRILITGRTSYSMSAFGEHLIGEEIEHAIAAAANTIGTSVADYAMGALFPQRNNELGRHLYIVEFTDGLPEPKTIQRFSQALDTHLCEENEDYQVHRHGDYGLATPQVQAVPKGTFAAWMKQRGQLGGQHKVPRIINDAALFEELKTFVSEPKRSD